MTAIPPAAANLSPTDILIVGAGPAGATASLFLAQAQIPHTLVDKATFPRGKVDGNVYGRKVVTVLNRLDERYFRELAAHHGQVLGCNGAQIFTPKGGSFRLKFTRPLLSEASETESRGVETMPFFTLNRKEFDAFLISKLDPQYTHTSWQRELINIEATPAGWTVTLKNTSCPEADNDILQPKLMIAADGAHSKVVSLLGLNRPETRYFDMIQGYYRGVSGFETDRHIEGHFLPEVNPGFFFMAPLADGTVNVGLSKPRSDMQQEQVDLHQLFQTAIASHPNLQERFAQSEVVSPLQDWPEVVGTAQPPPLAGDGYLLTGDAAGLCNPLTGFGTGNAMVSGQLAAQYAAQAVQEQTFSQANLQGYSRELYQQLRTEFTASQALHTLTQMEWVFNQLAEGPWHRVVKPVVKTVFRGAVDRLKQM